MPLLALPWHRRHSTALNANQSSSPAPSMGQNQVKASEKAPVATSGGTRMSHNALQGFKYDSKWTPSPSPSPPPSRIKQHRPDAARESGEAHCVLAARSGSDIGKAPEHKQVRKQRGTKGSVSQQKKGHKIKRRISGSALFPSSAIGADSHVSTAGLPAEELVIERLPSPYSPPVLQGGHHLADEAASVEMPSMGAQSMTAAATALSLCADGNHLRFALAPGSQPSAIASTAARDPIMASYPLASSASARSPINRPIERARTPSVSSDVSPAVDATSKPLEILQLSMRATALHLPQFASPYLMNELFATAEQDGDVEVQQEPPSSKRIALSRKSSPPPVLPAQHFTPLEGFPLDEELFDDSPRQNYLAAPPLGILTSLSPRSNRRPLPAAPIAKTPAIKAADAFATWQSYSEEEKLAMSRSSSTVPPVAATGKQEARERTPPPYKEEEQQMALPPVKPLRFRTTDKNKKKSYKGKNRTRSLSKMHTTPSEQRRGALRTPPKEVPEVGHPVFGSSSSSAAEDAQLLQHIELPARGRGRRDAMTAGHGKARMAFEARHDGRLGSEFKKGFNAGEIAQWLARTAVEPM